MRYIWRFVDEWLRGAQGGWAFAEFREFVRLGAVRPGALWVLMAVSLAFSSSSISGCGSQREPSEMSIVHTGTSEMVARLSSLRDQLPDKGMEFMADQRAAYLREVPLPEDERLRLGLLRARARAEILAGNPEDAFGDLEHGQLLAVRLGDHRERRELERWTALASFRLGEQDNCWVGTGESCIVPLRHGGVHNAQRGAQKALPLFLKLAASDPSDGTSRWLANLAAMAVGDWPNAIPEDLLPQPGLFEDGSEFPRFVNVAPQLEVDVLGLSGSVVLEDLDGDERLDLMVSSWGLDHILRLFRNCGDETQLAFCEVTGNRSGLDRLPGGLNLLHADYDNDGDADIYVMRGGWLGSQGQIPNSLLRNDGDWRFVDVTEEVGLLDYLPTQTAAWADYDRDGWLDLFVGAESLPGVSLPARLYRGRGDGTFEEVSARASLRAIGYIKASVWGDVNGDGWPDLFVSRFMEANQLWLNLAGENGRRFVEVAEDLGLDMPLRSFPSGFLDVNSDGRDDLLVWPFAGDFTSAGISASIASDFGLEHNGEVPRLFVSQKDGSYLDDVPGSELDQPVLAMGTNVGDLDGDGYPEVYVGTGAPSMDALVPNRMYRLTQGADFQEVTFSGGFAHLQKGHGVAFGDIDGDGDQDVYAVMGGAYSGDLARNVLFENPGFNTSWLHLRLQGTSANRSAIGARVRAEWTEEDEQGRPYLRVVSHLVSTGFSFGSSTLRVELGLNHAKQLDRLEVRWPSPAGRLSMVQTFEDVPVNRLFRLVQGSELELVRVPDR